MGEKDRSCEALEMGTAKSSVCHTFNSNGCCGDYLARRRTLIRITRGVLGRDCNARGNAIDSRRDSVDFSRTHRRNCAGCSVKSAPGELFHRKPCGLRERGFCAGLFCAAFRMEKSAYRYASITLAIIVLIPRSNAAWIVALHRFFEVSVGIVVALALAAVWPEHQAAPAKESAE